MGRRSGAPLTQEQVNRLKPGQVLNDGKVPGLGVRRGEDRLTWRLKVQVAKAGLRYTTKAGDERVRQFRVETLNPVGEMTLAEARERAEIVKGRIKTEIRDPEALRRRANASEITLKQAWDRYVEGRKVRRFDKNGVEVQKPLSPKSIRDLEDTLRLYFGDWQDRTLAVLAQEREAFEARFYDLTNNRGGRTANKAVGHFRAVWREAKGKLPELPDCPANAVTRLNAESERKSAYQPEELPAAVKAVWKAGRFRAGLHMFLMLSGQRSGAVKRAKRDQYHREAGYLDLIDDKGQSHPVPLSPQMIDLLDAMIALGDRYCKGTAYIFPSFHRIKGKQGIKGHVTDVRIKAPASSLMAAHRAKIGRGIGSEIGGHIWRHTWRSLYPVAGLSRHDATMMIGHAEGEKRTAHDIYAAPIISHLRGQQAIMSDYLMKQAGFAPDFRFTPGYFVSVRVLDDLEGLL